MPVKAKSMYIPQLHPYKEFLFRAFKGQSVEIHDCAFQVFSVRVFGKLFVWDWADAATLQNMASPYLKTELQDRSAKALPVAQITPHACLDNLQALRDIPRDEQLDVYCVMSSTNVPSRVACIEAIRTTGGNSITGIVQRADSALVPSHLLLPKKLTHADNYTHQRRAKLCVAAPGFGEKTWRHMETLALGSCLVMPETDVIWPAPLDGCAVTCKRDWSDLPAIIDYLLTHDAEREEIARAGQAYWEKWLSPAAFAEQAMAYA